MEEHKEESDRWTRKIFEEIGMVQIRHELWHLVGISSKHPLKKYEFDDDYDCIENMTRQFLKLALYVCNKYKSDADYDYKNVTRQFFKLALFVCNICLYSFHIYGGKKTDWWRVKS